MNRPCVALLLAVLGTSAQEATAAPPRSTSASAPVTSAKPKTTKRASSGTPQHRSTGTASRSTRKPTRARATPATKAGAKPAAPAPELLAEPEAPPTERGTSGASEVRVQATGGQPAAAVVKTETADEDKGVKTYTFGAQEVEGRLRSPQILYFLRRVRAEFDAEPLGHRSFLLELSDTRRHSALR